MKKLVLSFCFIGLAFYGYAQNEVQSKELTSPIMLDFLKNYQEKNAIPKSEGGIPFTSFLSKRGIESGKNTRPALENIDNMIVIKPNLVEIMRMPIVRPNENMHYTMKTVNSDTNKLQTIK